MEHHKKCIHADPLIRNPPEKLSLGEKNTLLAPLTTKKTEIQAEK
jgi:hypothetical protein